MAGPAPITGKKVVISALMVGWLVLLLYSLERKYDAKDYERVDEMVTAAGAPWSLEKELVERAGGAKVPCDKELTSSFRGLVRLICRPPNAEPYRFQVDLVQKAIRGEDARSAEVLAAVGAKRASDAGR